MPIQAIDDLATAYYLIAYDENSVERQDDRDGVMSQQVAKALREQPITDVFLISHGWRGDIPAAKTQYARWIKAMADCSADLARMKARRPSFLPLLIGLHWPSEPWGDDTLGDASAFGLSGDDPTQELVNEIAAKIVDTPAARRAIATIVQAAHVDNSPPGLTPEVREAYRILDRETGLAQNGAAARPGDDREAFDADSLYQESRSETISFGGWTDGILAPFRVLSFWKMKDRARQVGESGAHQLLVELMNISAEKDVRFHLMGHSFGCIVASAAVAGPTGSRLSRPVDSVALVQGALSLWSYCSEIPTLPSKGGYFRRMVSEKMVRGPIISTQSTFDRAVGTWYPWAAGARSQVTFAPEEFPKYGAVGAFGIQGPETSGESRMILNPDHSYGFEAGKIYNIDGSGVINVGGGFSGAHSDISKPEVAHAVWEAVMTQ